MADGDIKIKDLSAALQIDDSAEFVYTQDNGGTNTTFKAPVNQIARKIAEGTTYTNLETTAKTLVGAINELSHLGNPIIVGTTAPTSSQGADGNIYIQYTAGTGGADDTVDGIYAKLDGAWCEIETGGGGSGGHTIVDNGGTSLTQRTNLQFKGAYSEDNSTDDTTEVNVVRSMTRAEFDLLSADEKTGLINITDEIGGSGHTYSTDEQIFGTWIDGSTLYEKTINVNQTLGRGQNVLAHNISNIDECISITACCTYNSINEWLYLPYFSPQNVSGYSVAIGNVNATNYTITVGTAFQSVENVYVTIRYTKSST